MACVVNTIVCAENESTLYENHVTKGDYLVRGASDEEHLADIERWIREARNEPRPVVIAVVKDGCPYCKTFVDHVTEWEVPTAVLLLTINNDALRAKVYTMLQTKLDSNASAIVPNIWVQGVYQAAGSQIKKGAMIHRNT